MKTNIGFLGALVVVSIFLSVEPSGEAAAQSSNRDTFAPAGAAPISEKQAAESAYSGGDVTGVFQRLRPLADWGNATAQRLLGWIYWTGSGVPKDDEMALAWYRRAANQSECEAQHALGVMYFHGEGAPKNYVHAYKWFNLASACPDFTEDVRAFNAQAREQTGAKMTPEQIVEAQRLVREWKPEREAGKSRWKFW